MTPDETTELIVKGLHDMAFVISCDAESSLTPIEALFVIMITAAHLYTEDWAAEPGTGTAANMIVDIDDAAQPMRVLDPELSKKLTYLDLVIDQITDHVGHRIDPNWFEPGHPGHQESE